MNINMLDRFIEPAVLKRGREYAENGRVLEIEESEPGVYWAEVQGSELYEVNVELDDDGEVLSSECDCPFEGAICKHQAAVLIELLDERMDGHDEDADSGPHEAPVRHPEKLESLLEAASKETLIALLLDIADESRTEERRIRLYLSGSEGPQGIEACRALIRSSIVRHADKHGFVDWRNVDHAVKGAEKATDQALRTADGGNPLQAVAIHLCIMEEMMELLHSADDSSGTIGSLIHNNLEHIHEIAGDAGRLTSDERDKLLRMLIHAAEQPDYAGWSDWQLGLLRAAASAATTAELRSVWEEAAARLAEADRKDALSGSYLAEQIALMQYHQYAGGEEKAADRFLHENMHYPKFRKRAIEQAIDSGSYDKAIAWAEEGESRDRDNNLPGLVNQWRKFRYEAYRLSGQCERQRELGLELVREGEFDMYEQVKALYSPDEWVTVYAELLDQLEKQTYGWRSMYTRILVHENETSRLLAYVKERPFEVEQYYSHLVKEYRDEVLAIFRTVIERQASHASNRKQYQDVCRVIRLVRKIGGTDSAQAIVGKLLALYPNKPAFRDELKQV
ncbi:SWIM zinc finger family protein [Paenibacillus sp. GYB003]|uniref:SWIM zinc finger family protein n=1 Tax=Paenibacillus sp. GYB003 TaxID=2994392 RepID=UPI002F96DF76